MLIQMTVWATEDGKYDETKEQENRETMSIVKPQVIFFPHFGLRYLADLNEHRWTNCHDKI